MGASGAIFGLAGAIMSLIYVHRKKIELAIIGGIVLAIWSIYTLVLGAMSPIVSNSCHLGGLVGGLILGAGACRRLSSRIAPNWRAGP